ncbi:MAG: DUF308 domain-containing protein [Sulfuricaulis sp.]
MNVNMIMRPIHMALLHMTAGEIRDRYGIFLAASILLILLETLAIVFLHAAAVTVIMTFGWILVVSGLCLTARMYHWQKGGSFFLIFPLMALLAWVLLLVYPLTGMLTLSLLIALFLLLSGSFRAELSLLLRPARRWERLLCSDLVASGAWPGDTVLAAQRFLPRILRTGECQ